MKHFFNWAMGIGLTLLVVCVIIFDSLDDENISNAFDEGYKKGQTEASENQPADIGTVFENTPIVIVNFIFPADGLMEVGDTLFFITKNDTVFTCSNKKHGNLYMRRLIVPEY